MVVSLFVAGLVLGSLPTLVRRLGVRVPMREWAALCLVALAAALVESALVAWAALRSPPNDPSSASGVAGDGVGAGLMVTLSAQGL